MSARNSDARAIVVRRLIGAPRALVFDAWTDPKRLAHWWGPIGFTTTTSAFEFREGGVWRFVMHGPDGRDYQNRITWDEIKKPERIAYHHGGGSDVEPVQFRSVVTFEDEHGMTRLTLRMEFASAEERDRVEREYGALEGGYQTVGRLADFLSQNASDENLQFAFSRVLDAPRALVWSAWTDPQHVAQWWGPRGFTNPVCELDVRPGGAWRIEQIAPDGKRHIFTGEYFEVLAPERLVGTQCYFEHPPVLIATTFEDMGGKTKVTTLSRFASRAEMDGHRAAGMEWGMGQSFDRLAEHLAELR